MATSSSTRLIPMPQPAGVAVAVRCARCKKWRRFFTAVASKPVFNLKDEEEEGWDRRDRNGTELCWTCELNPDPRFQTCEAAEEAVKADVKELENGPWNFKALQIPMFDRAHYDKYFSYPGWTLKETLALLRYVLKFRHTWEKISQDDILWKTHPKFDDCERRYLHLVAMAKLFPMMAILQSRCRPNVIKQYLNQTSRDQNKSLDVRLKSQKDAQSQKLKAKRENKSRRKQKFNLVYLRTDSARNKKKAAEKKKKKKKKKNNKRTSDEWSEPPLIRSAPTRVSSRLRGKERKTYVFEDNSGSDDEDDMEEDEDEDQEPEFLYRAEKVLAARSRKSIQSGGGGGSGGNGAAGGSEGAEAAAAASSSGIPMQVEGEEEQQQQQQQQYLVKIEGVSYRHCRWLSETEMERLVGHDMLVRRLGKFNREREKIERENWDYFDGEPYNPMYKEVDRILDETTIKTLVGPDGKPLLRFPTYMDEEYELKLKIPKSIPEGIDITGSKEEDILMYLVKWKELSYTHCTWELASEVKDEMKIAEYRRFNRPPVLQPMHGGRPCDRHPTPLSWYKKSKFYKGGNQLRIYQVHGLNWLIGCYLQKHNGILADEMGLGKTVQIVTFLEHLRQIEQVYGPHLIVVPLSTVQNWRREVETWTDMNAVVYHDLGRKQGRKIMESYEWYYRHMQRKAVKFNILITTYEIVSSETDALSNIPWATMIIDEGHKLKNSASRLLSDLQTIKGTKRQPRVLLLTGTPIQNNAEELFSLLNFIEPKKFPSKEEFHRSFGDLKQAEQVRRLKEVIAPYMIRRMKEKVEKHIPPKEEIIIDIELTTLQKQYYRAVYERNASFLRASLGQNGKTKQVSLSNVEIQLRKCCNHPWLLEGVEEKECHDLMVENEQYFQRMIDASGKMVLLDKLLQKLQNEGHRVLIFSQMKKMLDILGHFMEFRKYRFERLDGGITGNERQKAIDRFCKPNSNRFVFLLSTRAGGVGLNLTQADTVIIFDIDWNPQQDMQAQARAHRIGQKKGVRVYRLITRNTYESEMFARASKKLGLDHAVLHDMNKEGGGTSKDGRPDDIDKILRLGVYGMLDNDEEKSKKFCESDINDILKTSSRVITSSNGGANDKVGELATASVGNINYSKMIFESEGADGSIDIDDPEFWDKVLPGSLEGVTPSELLSQLTGGSSLESDQELEDFFQKLQALSERVIQARKNGDPCPEINELIDLLIQFSVMSRFPADLREQAESWCEELQKRPKRRREPRKKKETPESSGERLAKRGRRKRDLDGSMNGDDDEVALGEGKARGGGSRKKKGGGKDKQGKSGSGMGGSKFNSRVCDICYMPGELLLCDGPCERAFHLDCLGDDARPPPGKDEVWQCVECEALVHKCCQCGLFAKVERETMNVSWENVEQKKPRARFDQLRDEVLEEVEPVRQCSITPCGRYYHLHCVHSHPLAKFIGDVNAGYQSFRCPRHYCVVCQKSGNNRHLLNCVKCPNAYHVACLKRGTYTRLTRKHMFCPSCHTEAEKTEEGRAAIAASKKTTKAELFKPQKRIGSAGAGRSKRRGKKDGGGFKIKFRIPKNLKQTIVPITIKPGESYDVKFVWNKQTILKQEACIFPTPGEDAVKEEPDLV